MVPETRLRKISWQKCDLKALSWKQGLAPWVRGQCSRPRLFLRQPLPPSDPCAGQLQGPDWCLRFHWASQGISAKGRPLVLSANMPTLQFPPFLMLLNKKVRKSQADVQSRALNCGGAMGTCDGEGQACPGSCGTERNQPNHRNTVLTEVKTMNSKILQSVKRLPG